MSIVKRGDQICAVSETLKDAKGRRRAFGCYSISEHGVKGARALAHKRLGQVEAFQRKGK